MTDGAPSTQPLVTLPVRILAVCEVALAFVLLVGAGLMINRRREPPGRPGRVQRARLDRVRGAVRLSFWNRLPLEGEFQ